ncbi:MAG: hypothetical protein Q8K00_19340 [Syntrophales bacterium]|nr:hypothetical protein [Syntrophales bacterium]
MIILERISKQIEKDCDLEMLQKYHFMPIYEKGIQAGEFILPKCTVNLLKAEMENGFRRKTSVECDTGG